MASLSETSPVTVPALIAAQGREPIAMMTAYDAPSAALLDEAGSTSCLSATRSR